MCLKQSVIARILERVKGIEPSYKAWEAFVLPLNYTRVRRRIMAKKSKSCKYFRLRQMKISLGFVTPIKGESFVRMAFLAA